MKGELKEILEQDAIFDGKLDLMPMSLAINILNHNSWGGTPDDMREAAKEIDNPRRYRITLALYVEDVTPNP